jgi:hypothetical protein
MQSLLKVDGSLKLTPERLYYCNCTNAKTERLYMYYCVQWNQSAAIPPLFGSARVLLAAQI